MSVVRVGLGGAGEDLEGLVDVAARSGDRTGETEDLRVVRIVVLRSSQRRLGAVEVTAVEQLPAALDRIARRGRHPATIARARAGVTRFALDHPGRYSRRVEQRHNGARWIVILLAVMALACPGRTKRKVGPDLPLPTNGDKQALRRFEETRARFQRSGGTAAGGPQDPAARGAVVTEFEAIARDYPEDPIAPHARLYAGM